MDHADHVRLIRGGVEPRTPGAAWADFGSGGGAFTLALADLLGPGATIFSIDLDRAALREQARRLRDRFPAVTVHQLVADFNGPLPPMPPLEGVVMANSLHFQRDKLPALERVRASLGEGGRLVLVEYDTDRGNQWVPYPLSFETWRLLSAEAGFGEARRLAAVPSRFLGSIYSAVSVR